MSSLRSKLEDDVLDLSLMGLEEVPVKEIATITKGTNLDLSNNRLTSLPFDFGTLVHLVQLDLSKNQLEELPENFGQLRHLRRLDLYSNRLDRLPVSFADLKSLKWLDLKNNRLSNALQQAAGDCITPADCAMCAKKVVALMQSAKSQLELERERLRQQELRALTEKRAVEERERERIRAEKRAAKERRREEARLRERNRSEGKESKQPSFTDDNATEDNGIKRTVYSDKKKRSGQSWLGWFLCQFLPMIFLSLAFFTIATGISLLWVYTDGRLDQKNVERALPILQRDIENVVVAWGQSIDKVSKPYVKEALLTTNEAWIHIKNGYSVTSEFIEPYICCLRGSVKDFWVQKASPFLENIVKPALSKLQVVVMEGVEFVSETATKVIGDVTGRQR